MRTVIDGTQPTDLAIRWHELVPSPYNSNAYEPYLMIETDPADERWSEWGGAAAGMSGSPVVLDVGGELRLAGAL